MNRLNNNGELGPDQIDLGPHKLEGSLIVSVSTCHVTARDCLILDRNCTGVAENRAEHPQYLLPKPDQGFLVSVWEWRMEDGDDATSIEAELAAAGHSAEYINVCRICADAGAKYLDLDADGRMYHFLPTVR